MGEFMVTWSDGVSDLQDIYPSGLAALAAIRGHAENGIKNFGLWERRALRVEVRVELLNDFPPPAVEGFPPPARDESGGGNVSRRAPEVVADRNGSGAAPSAGADSARRDKPRETGDAIAPPAGQGGRELAGLPPHRWGRMGTDPWHAWHVVEGITSGEALCREVTDESLGEELADGVKPRAVEACLDCADEAGWEAPGRLAQERAPDPAPEKKKRGCIIPGCGNPGSSRKQWHCVEHAAKSNVQERQAVLTAWNKLAKEAAAHG